MARSDLFYTSAGQQDKVGAGTLPRQRAVVLWALISKCACATLAANNLQGRFATPRFFAAVGLVCLAESGPSVPPPQPFRVFCFVRCADTVCATSTSITGMFTQVGIDGC